MANFKRFKVQQLIELTGKRGIYIESRIGCVVKIKAVWFDRTSVFLSLVSDGNLIKKYGNGETFVEENCPFGDEWEVSKPLNCLSLITITLMRHFIWAGD